MEKSEKKICLFGASLDTGNMGVTALAKSLISLFSDDENNHIVLFSSQKKDSQKKEIKISENRSVEVDILSYFTVMRKPYSNSLAIVLILSLVYRIFPFFRRKILKTNKFINSLVTSSFIGDIRGGDSFSDIYGIKRLINGTLPIMIINILKLNYYFLPQKYGPFNSRFSRVLAKKSLSKAIKIYSRDKDDTFILDEFANSIDQRKVLYCPDVAFSLPAYKPLELSIDGDNDILHKNPIGINISGLLWLGGYNENNMFGLVEDYKQIIIGIIEELKKTANRPLLLVPHTICRYGTKIENDYLASKEIKDDYYNDVSILSGNYDACELKWIISHCSFFMGARMHSCIAALSQNIPTIGHAYSDKFAGVFHSVYSENNVIDLRAQKLDEIMMNTRLIYEKRKLLKEELHENTEVVRNVIAKEFEHILS